MKTDPFGDAWAFLVAATSDRVSLDAGLRRHDRGRDTGIGAFKPLLASRPASLDSASLLVWPDQGRGSFRSSRREPRSAD